MRGATAIRPRAPARRCSSSTPARDAAGAGGAIGCEPGEQATVPLAFAGTYEFAVDVVQDAGHRGSLFGTRYADVVTTPVPAAGGLLAGPRW